MKALHCTIIGVWLVGLAIPLPRPRIKVPRGTRGAGCGIEGGGAVAKTGDDMLRVKDPYLSQARRLGLPSVPAGFDYEPIDPVTHFQILLGIDEDSSACTQRMREQRDGLALARGDEPNVESLVARWDAQCAFDLGEAEEQLAEARAAFEAGELSLSTKICDRLEGGVLTADASDDVTARAAYVHEREQLCSRELILDEFGDRVELAEAVRAADPEHRPLDCRKPHDKFQQIEGLATSDASVQALIDRWWDACLFEDELANLHNRSASQ